MSAEYKKILVTLDGSEFAARALPHAQLMAKSLGAVLVLLEVVPEVEAKADTADTAGRFIRVQELSEQASASLERNQLNVIEAAERDLEQLAKNVANEHHIRTESVTKVGKPAQRIIEFARNNDIDLIVMTTHGRTGLAHLVYGSVAEKVLHAAKCPVLLIRSAVKD